MKMEEVKKCNICGGEEVIVVDKYNNLCRCKNCRYFFISPRPTLDEIQEFYSRSDKYNGWLAELGGRDSLWKKRLKLVKKEKQSGRLLDVGTGIGQFLFFAKDDFEVHGTEISKSAIKIAKERFQVSTVRLGEIDNIDFGVMKFDVITCFHVLEHVQNPFSTIKRCKALLSNNAVLIIAVPNELNAVRHVVTRLLIKLLIKLKIKKSDRYGGYGISKITLDKNQSEVHLSYFTVSTLKKLLEKNGFYIVRDTLDPYYVCHSKIDYFTKNLFFISCLVIKKIFDRNIYDTIWITAKVKK